jgi:glycosyltransferase involved in cell wall biosynthesis
MAPRYGGPPKAAISLGQGVAEYGIDSYWWATATADEKKELAYLGKNACLFHSRTPNSWHRSPELKRELRKRIDEADILHLHQIWDYPLWVASKLARKFGKPYIVTPHGIFCQPWRYGSIKKKIYLWLIARSILNNASAIHAVNSFEVDGIKNIGIKVPYVVIPNGIDVEKYNLEGHYENAKKIWPNLSGKKVVLYLGRISPEKGLDILLQSWKETIKIDPNALLLIAGSDCRGYLEKINNIVRIYKLEDKVLFTGFIQGFKKEALLNKADIYVLPSYSEGFSMGVLEALASSKPCIITKDCNFPEVQDWGAGYVIPTGNKEALSHALIKMISLSKIQRKKMGESGRLLVKKQFTLDIMTRKMKTVYECVISKRTVPIYP